MTTSERIETHAGCPLCGGKQVINMGSGITRACDYYGGKTFLTPNEEDDSPVPPEAGHRRTKELSNSARAIWQRKHEKERSQRRRDALKRIREEV
jgi:hypothetical protein